MDEKALNVLSGTTEPFVTITKAAEKLGLYVWKLRRAVKAGAVPVYRPFNSRPMVRVSEVESAILATREGGAR